MLRRTSKLVVYCHLQMKAWVSDDYTAAALGFSQSNSQFNSLSNQFYSNSHYHHRKHFSTCDSYHCHHAINRSDFDSTRMRERKSLLNNHRFPFSKILTYITLSLKLSLSLFLILIIIYNLRVTRSFIIIR